MTRSIHRFRCAALLALALPLTAGVAMAQDRGPGFLDNLFNRGEENAPAQPVPGGSSSDIAMRLDRLENSLRQLTGNIEQLQYRNQQLEAQVRELQQRAGIQAAPGAVSAPGSIPMRPLAGPTPPVAPVVAPPATAPDRRSDVFDPSRNPNAPGAPRPLGTQTASASPMPAIGAPGGREAGAPLDLNTLSANPAGAAGAAQPSGLPPPPPRNPSATGARLATLPPSAKPQDEYDMAYGYVLHKDYGLATQAFRDFIRKYPDEKLVPDAQYWLGESLYQQQHYREAAESFLALSTKHERSGKAPEGLLRLGQSLAALHQKEAACATLAQVGRKYPHAAAGVKRTASQELKKQHC